MKIIIHDGPIGKEQFRFPRTKNRRIRKKWSARDTCWRNTFLKQPIFDQDRNALICTARMAAQLRRRAAEEGLTGWEHSGCF